MMLFKIAHDFNEEITNEPHKPHKDLANRQRNSTTRWFLSSIERVKKMLKHIMVAANFFSLPLFVYSLPYLEPI